MALDSSTIPAKDGTEVEQSLRARAGPQAKELLQVKEGSFGRGSQPVALGKRYELVMLVAYQKLKYLKRHALGASLVAQWLRICLPMQGTRVRALVWEDPTCRGATRPVSHNY